MADKNLGQGWNFISNKFVLIATVLVAVLFLVLFWPRQTTSPVQDTPSPNESAEINNGALQVVMPVTEDGFQYEFTGIKWIFDTTSPEVSGTNQTWLKMTFADFTRNGNAITFGTPYKLGVHEGVCKEVDSLETDTNEKGVPFSYVVCESENIKKEFVAFQREKEIVVRVKEIKNGHDPVLKDWYKIDVTEIVK
jgi:hypothetical protein